MELGLRKYLLFVIVGVKIKVERMLFIQRLVEGPPLCERSAPWGRSCPLPLVHGIEAHEKHHVAGETSTERGVGALGYVRCR